MILVDGERNLVRALRAVTLSPAFTAVLHAAIRTQAETTSDPALYDAKIQEAYAAWPNTRGHGRGGYRALPGNVKGARSDAVAGDRRGTGLVPLCLARELAFRKQRPGQARNRRPQAVRQIPTKTPRIKFHGRTEGREGSQGRDGSRGPRAG